MTDTQLYLVIGVPILFNAAMLTLMVTLLRDLWRTELRREGPERPQQAPRPPGVHHHTQKAARQTHRHQNPRQAVRAHRRRHQHRMSGWKSAPAKSRGNTSEEVLPQRTPVSSRASDEAGQNPTSSTQHPTAPRAKRALDAILILPMARKAAVIGSAGQLGVELVSELNQRGYQTIGWDRSQLDITDNRQVESMLTPWDPEIVFNAAAYNQVDVAESEPQAAFLVNALAVRNLALACRQLDARFVHFSTDYVFDGASRRPYLESDPTH